MEISEANRLTHFIALNAPEAPEHFVSGIRPELNDGSWRWALKSATLQFQLPDTRGVKLRIDLTVPEVTFQQTGPVKIAVFVDGHELDTIDFPQPGPKLWEKPVPKEWLSTTHPVLVRLEIDKIYKSPTDGAERGYILSKIGFVQ